MTLNPCGTVDGPRELGLGVRVDHRVLDKYTIARDDVRMMGDLPAAPEMLRPKPEIQADPSRCRCKDNNP